MSATPPPLRRGTYQPRSFDEAHAHLFQPLCRFVRGRADALGERVRLPDGAEEIVVQRVFDAAFATGWHHIRQPRAWLYAVAGAHLRRLAGGPRDQLGHHLSRRVPWTPATGTSIAEVGVAAIVAGHAVCELPDHHAQVGYLHLCERWTFTEIADALGISETAARAHADTACDLLQHAIAGEPVTLHVGAQAHPAEPLFAVHVPRRRTRRPRRPPDPFSVLAVLLAGVLTAAGGLILGSVWRVVFLVAGAVLTGTGATLGALSVRAGSAPGERVPSAAARVLLLAVGFYRVVLAPVLPSSCRFTPSCSDYAQQAIRRHGAARGTWLAARRLGRCRPAGPRGHDPVPGAARHGKPRRRRSINL
ncbi:membrane protein insertion efficiency factor YidD [Amycolatopsis sp. YIM 10]|uniref:membrane protein insertion efficiency factor YidD n=1 Tax=Amycolatopsis sp. YIM 10 TaxID=2653857 RepID=UPI0012AA7D6C|nr:membrane protein insertion efficiency factor YidD [Amycolatopsis sp. YIM 10]QFU90187.1 Putative membrane protein insertion efficiency factor [Amycolatopsis sp. YIM 10]